MRSHHSSALAGLAGAAAVAGCAVARAPAAPDVPGALRAPAGQVVFVEALATGVQIYQCDAKPGSGYEWAFKAPEAALVDRAGRSLGRHFAGPTWQSEDGSAIVGEVKASDPGPDPAAIPWLLLAAKSNSGPGVFEAARSVQRVATVGGRAPAEPCTEARLKQVARVPYTAIYYFYRAAS
jgi:Protein of unknown function (DUF3455)